MSVLPGASRGRWISLSPCYFRSPLWPGLSLTNPAAFVKGGRIRQKLKPRSPHCFCRRTRAHKAGGVLSAPHLQAVPTTARHGTARRSMTLLRFSKNSRASAKRARAARRAQVSGNQWRGRGATGIPPRVLAETAAAPTRKRPRVRRIVLFLL
jgi:hypothetical protein